MKTVLIGAGLVIAGPLISAIVTLSTVLLTTPDGWFIGAIGLIAGAAYAIYKNWEPLTQFFSDTWQSILGIFEAGMAKVMPIVNKLTSVADKVTKPVRSLFEFGGNAADAVTGVASDAVSGVKSFFGGGERERQSILSGNQRTQVGGQVSIKIDSEGRPRVQQVRSDNPSVGLNVDAGMSLVGAM